MHHSLTSEQQTAQALFFEWLRKHIKSSLSTKRSLDPFVLTGYAGTGKTTLLKSIITQLDILGYSYGCASFTGKASKVLQSKGIPNAKTIHSYIYEPVVDSNGVLKGFTKIKKPLKLDVFIIDEVSMVSDSMMREIKSVVGLVLAVGDVGQLPAITKDPKDYSFLHNHKSDAALQENHRSESNIISLANYVRFNGQLPFDKTQYIQLLYNDAINYSIGDATKITETQIIVFTNKQRRATNDACRTIIHGRYIDEPVMGDKIICTKNFYADNGSLRRSNGLILYVCDNPKRSKQRFFGPKDYKTGKRASVVLDMVEFPAYDEYGDLHENCVCPLLSFTNPSQIPPWVNTQSEFYEFGYAITCHKAQGSEFNHVVVMSSGLFNPVGNPLFTNQWLYTAITRAKQSVVFC